MGFDVFISYPHQDKATADAACAKLEAEGIRCWIAPRDIAPSAEWAASIVEAIDQCGVMVFIFSGHANRSKQVHRELQQAFDGEKPVVPFRIENVNPEQSLRYYMGTVHWLDALTPPLENHLKQLSVVVKALLDAKASRPPQQRPSTPSSVSYTAIAKPPVKRGFSVSFRIWAVFAVLWVLGWGGLSFSSNTSADVLVAIDLAIALVVPVTLLVVGALIRWVVRGIRGQS